MVIGECDMSRVTSENYASLQGWMVTELGLHGNELIVYAAIFGFTQKKGQWFNNSRQYLADWTGTTKQTVSKHLQSLVDKGLLEKRERYENGVKFCDYRVKNSPTPGEKINQGGIKNQPGVGENFNQGGVKNHPHNKQYTYNDLNNINTNKSEAELIEELFEYLWSLYPRKVGKAQVNQKNKEKHFKIGFKHMERAINRYLDDLKKESWRHPQNGSTFFNSGYVDYLDENYHPVKSQVEQDMDMFNSVAQMYQ